MAGPARCHDGVMPDHWNFAPPWCSQRRDSRSGDLIVSLSGTSLPLPTFPAAASDSRPTTGEWTWLAVILLLALVLRLVGLDGALWYDEIDTLIRYVRLPTADLVGAYDSLNNHMLFSLEAQLSVALFGESAWALRLPALLFGLASIWALWRLARMVCGPREALLAALLMAVSYHHVWFSQNARGYTGLLFFGLVATQCLLAGLRRPTWGVGLVYGLCLALSMYTHLSSAFLFLAHGLAYLAVLAVTVLRGRRLPEGVLVRPLGGVLAGVGLTLVLYAPVLGQIGATFGRVQSGPPSAAAQASVAHWQSPLWMITEIAGSLGPVLAPVLPVVLVVLGVAMVSLARRTPVLPLVLVLHVGLTVAILAGLGFRIWPRYFFADIGLICLMLIHGAYVIGDAAGLRLAGRRLGALLAVAGIAASLVILPRNYMAPKQDFTGARDFVEAGRGTGAQVLTIGLTTMPFVDYYAPGWTGIDDLASLQAALATGRETWVVYTFPDVLERRHADIFAALAAAGFVKRRYFPGTLSGGGIVVLGAAEDPA